ncbi:hypothetical protein Vadar_015897 [Vaccinium darrowii]|uniref:Uncharacterized protein n=1 Tax=Vaccinium darrowii TaxID=229202 RepID=A0ACB7ZCZ0_9ERIC|nr:hypothetical protein Vadar_015897 [Vaccinium darrowii]
MNLCFNTATGQNWNLTSWSIDYLPATGAFTMGWVPTPDSGHGGGLDFPLAAGIITIETGKELYYGSFLESDGENSTLGFFTTERTKYTYLGIWYTNDPQQRKVWVANTDTPLDNTAAALTIDNTTGILKITSGGNTVFNISNQLAANPTTKIKDTGEKLESHFLEQRLFAGNRLWELKPDSRIEEGANSNIFGPSGFCYGYKSGDGCVTSVLPQCRSSNDKFEEKRASFLPSIATSEYDENSSQTISDCMEMCWSDCMEMCWSDCNCVAFAINSNGTGCITWIGKREY